MKLFYVLIALILLSCGTTKTAETSTVIDSVKEEETTLQLDAGPIDSYNVKISITHYTPYCGGAAPPDDIVERSTRKQSNTNFMLIDHSNGEKTTVQTDSLGILYLHLSKGSYAIREPYKNCSFDEFYEKNYQVSDQWHQPTSDPNCYRNWWASNLQEINVTKVDSIYSYKVQTTEACFVGRNPCIMYAGPMPP